MNGQPTRLHWISTLGGPHLVIPEAYASAWEGGAAPTAGRVVEATFRCNPHGPATDYDRACSVNDGWLGVIPVGSGMALVVRGEDSAVAYYRTTRGEHFILQWYTGASETALLDHFHDVRIRLTIEGEVFFRHPGGKLLLMDSVDIPGQYLTPPSVFVLPGGKYRVETSHSECDEAYIIVHRFCRESR
jgi:hypothetical protein